MSRRGQIWLYSLALAFVLIGLIAAITRAFAQGGPLQQGGAITPGHVARFVTNGVVGDGGSAQNGTVTEIGITGQGTPFCLNDAATTGPFHQLCFGANSLGGGLISFEAYNGAPVTPLMCNINGVQTECELSASNVSNIAGPLSVAGNTSLGGNLNVSGNTYLQGNLWANGNITAPNIGVGVVLTVDDQINTGNLGATGNVAVQGTTNLIGPAYTNTGLDISGQVPGTTTSLWVNGNIRVETVGGVGGDLDMGGALRVAGSGSTFFSGLLVNGQLEVYGDAFADSWQINSDKRLKSDIEDFKPPSIAAVKQLRPVSYRFGTGSLHHGLIADEVQKILPQAVSEHKGIKTIDPMVLIDVLIAANHELAERVEALEKRVGTAH